MPPPRKEAGRDAGDDRETKRDPAIVAMTATTRTMISLTSTTRWPCCFAATALEKARGVRS